MIIEDIVKEFESQMKADFDEIDFNSRIHWFRSTLTSYGEEREMEIRGIFSRIIEIIRREDPNDDNKVLREIFDLAESTRNPQNHE